MTEITVHQAKINAFVECVLANMHDWPGPPGSGQTLEEAIETATRLASDRMDDAQIAEAAEEARQTVRLLHPR